MKNRTFETGANRDSDAGKPNHGRYNSPLVDAMYARYLHACNEGRAEPRRGDNWKKGMPLDVYFESFLRHVLDMRTILDGFPVHDPATGAPVTLERAMCAARFNLSGMMHETAVAQREGLIDVDAHVSGALPIGTAVDNALKRQRKPRGRNYKGGNR